MSVLGLRRDFLGELLSRLRPPGAACEPGAFTGFARMAESGAVSARFLIQYGMSATAVKERIQELNLAVPLMGTGLRRLRVASAACFPVRIAGIDPACHSQPEGVEGLEERIGQYG